MSLMRRHRWRESADGEPFSLAYQAVDFGRLSPSESSALAPTVTARPREKRRHQEFGTLQFRSYSTGRSPLRTGVGAGTSIIEH